jgi:hypothetical protein
MLIQGKQNHVKSVQSRQNCIRFIKPIFDTNLIPNAIDYANSKQTELFLNETKQNYIKLTQSQFNRLY